MKLSTLISLLCMALLQAVVTAQVTPRYIDPPTTAPPTPEDDGNGQGGDCPLVPGCCDDDCCGPHSSWNGDGCVEDIGEPGWEGYGPDHEYGCVLRKCCETDCCGEGLFYDEDLGCCLSENVPAPPQ